MFDTMKLLRPLLRAQSKLSGTQLLANLAWLEAVADGELHLAAGLRQRGLHESG